MAVKQPEVEWADCPYTMTRLGVLGLAGKWAVVMQADNGHHVVMTEWLDSRDAAIGFLKLTKESWT